MICDKKLLLISIVHSKTRAVLSRKKEEKKEENSVPISSILERVTDVCLSSSGLEQKRVVERKQFSFSASLSPFFFQDKYATVYRGNAALKGCNNT